MRRAADLASLGGPTNDEADREGGKPGPGLGTHGGEYTDTTSGVLKSPRLRPGKVAEWFKAAVLKTAVGLVFTVSSNLTLSARRLGRCRSGRSEPPAKRLFA